MSRKISDKDKKDWENFLSKNETLPNKDNLFKKKKFREQLTFDLHGFSLNKANNKISDLISYAYDNGVRRLIIVTGKGLHSNNEQDPYISKDLGILRYSVPEYIKSNNELMAKIVNIESAEVKDGGSGAFYIYIKKKL